MDDDFLALPLQAAADAALSVARAAGATHADVRVQRVRTQSLTLRDGAVQAAVDGTDCGLAVRVLLDGTWGFASHPVPGPAGAADAAAPGGGGRPGGAAAEPGPGALGGRAGVSGRGVDLRVRDRPVRRAHRRQGGAARRLLPPPPRRGRRGPRHRRRGAGQGADVLRRSGRIVDHPAAGAGAPATRGRHRGPPGGHLRVDAHPGAAGRARLGVPELRHLLGLDGRTGRGSPACWPRKRRHRR